MTAFLNPATKLVVFTAAGKWRGSKFRFRLILSRSCLLPLFLRTVFASYRSGVRFVPQSPHSFIYPPGPTGSILETRSCLRGNPPNPKRHLVGGRGSLTLWRCLVVSTPPYNHEALLQGGLEGADPSRTPRGENTAVPRSRGSPVTQWLDTR